MLLLQQYMPKFREGKPVLNPREQRRALERENEKRAKKGLPPLQSAQRPLQQPGARTLEQRVVSRTVEAVMHEARTLEPAEFVDIYAHNLLALEPYRSLAIEAFRVDESEKDGERSSQLALVELLASAGTLYDTGWEQTNDFESKALLATRLLMLAVSHLDPMDRMRIGPLNQEMMSRAQAHNPLMSLVVRELAVTEELYHVGVAADIPNAGPKSIARNYAASRVRDHKNPYRNSLVENIGRSLNFAADVRGVKLPDNISEYTALAHIAFAEYQWDDVLSEWPDRDAAQKPSEPTKSYEQDFRREFFETPALHSFFVNDAVGVPFARVDILQPTNAYIKDKRMGALPDAIVNVRVQALTREGATFAAEISRLNGSLCIPNHSMSTLRRTLGDDLHAHLRNVILTEVDRVLHLPKPEAFSSTEVETVQADPVDDFEAPHAAVDEVLAVETPDDTIASPYVPSQVIKLAEEITPDLLVGELDLPKRMRIGEMVATFKRIDPNIVIRTGGKHPVIERVIADQTFTYTSLNAHGGDKGSVARGLIAEAIAALGMTPVEFIIHAHGSQARDIRRRLKIETSKI